MKKEEERTHNGQDVLLSLLKQAVPVIPVNVKAAQSSFQALELQRLSGGSVVSHSGERVSASESLKLPRSSSQRHSTLSSSQILTLLR